MWHKVTCERLKKEMIFDSVDTDWIRKARGEKALDSVDIDSLGKNQS